MLRSLYRPCSRCLGLRLHTAARVSAPARFQSTTTSASDVGPSPILLQRARAIAAEHSVLSTQNAADYNVKTAKRIGELSNVVDALTTWDEAHSSLSELEHLLADPTSDGELQSLASSDIASLTSSLPTLSRRLSAALIPPHPFTALPCLLEFHPGAGGSEASLFAHELLHMYTSYCARLGLSCKLQSYAKDESVSGNGTTHAILAINTPGTYNTFRSEIGVHRVQRVPATEKKGRTHTSAVSVMVLPQLPESGENELNYEDPSSDYYIAPNDVRSETMRASGAGGQHVNKTESAIRLTHIPTGIVVGVQEERSQHKNRDQAWKILRSRIAARRREEREAETIALRRKAMGGVARTGREDKVRTYNFSQNRVSDHRSGWEGSNLPEIMEGGLGLDSLMESVREWMDENEVKGLIAEEEEKASEKTNSI